MSCKFCSQNEREYPKEISNVNNRQLYSAMHLNHFSSSLEIDVIDKTVSEIQFEINYCPMCGTPLRQSLGVISERESNQDVKCVG